MAEILTANSSLFRHIVVARATVRGRTNRGLSCRRRSDASKKCRTIDTSSVIPNKRHSSDVSQTVAPPTFVNCRTSDEIWFDVCNIALPMLVNRCNSDSTWSDILDVALPTSVRCRNADDMWSDVWNFALPTFGTSIFRRLERRSSDVCNLSQFRRNAVRRFYTVSLPTFLGCRSSDVYKASVDRRRVQFKKKN